jgi:glucosamine--fructose-6-phosphate aminotransferase (isomerizing)
MCGIFGYIGAQDPLKICVAGLEQLEYRGYDSTGIAGTCAGKISFCKKAGKLSNLLEAMTLRNLESAIGHTRWATHGQVNDQNAHPHLDAAKSMAIIHNGIIENHHLLRSSLQREGVQFSSDTDTEVIVQLVAKFYEGDLASAVQKALSLVQGIYAILLIHKDHPELIIAAAKECPLAIGVDPISKESFLSSDPNTFLSSNLDVIFLNDGEVATIQRGRADVYNALHQAICKKTQRLELQYTAPSKDGFDHFLLKEIHEQPSTVLNAIFGRFQEQTGNVEFESLLITDEKLSSYKKVCILACGGSAHAGSIGSAYLEELAHIPSQCEIASEARYRPLLLTPDTLVIAISQSGETADTIAALRMAKSAGCTILAICNVKHSTITREADGVIYLRAGAEISVCSTKALTSQIAILALFAVHMARLRGLNPNTARTFFNNLKQIPDQINQVLMRAPILQKLAEKYAHYDDFFFMGRLYMYTTSLEGALKLKEISYVNANGCPAGELKHGPFALINSHFPVVAFCANNQTKDKILSNLAEVKARGAPVLAFAPLGMAGVNGIADDVFWLPPTTDMLAPFTATVAAQLLAYYIALKRGCNIDQPRNLAKSVTVE